MHGVARLVHGLEWRLYMRQYLEETGVEFGGSKVNRCPTQLDGTRTCAVEHSGSEVLHCLSTGYVTVKGVV